MSEPTQTPRPPLSTPSPNGARRVWIAVAVVAVVSLAVSAVVGLGGGDGEVKPPAGPKPVAVRVVKAERGDMTVRARYRGELDADVAEIAAQTTGYLLKLSVGIGDEVKESDTLGQVEPTQAERDVAAAQAEVLAAQAAKKRNAAQLRAAETEYQRGQQSLAKKLISEKEAAQLKAELEVLEAEAEAANAQLVQATARVASLRERLRDTRLTAPFDGAVAERYVDPGTVVQPGTAILRLVRKGPLRVRFRVPERDLARLKVGMPLTVTTQAGGDERFSGKVVRISAEVSRVNRTIAVEGLLDAEHAALRPGMYTEVSLVLGQLEKVVTIPSEAVIEQLDRNGLPQRGVFVVADGHAHWQPLTIEGESGDRTAGRELTEGQAVVVLGQHNLRDGSPVRTSAAESEGGK